MNAEKTPVRRALFGLYPIIDLKYVLPADIRSVTSEIIEAGAGKINILQLRAKAVPADIALKVAKEIRAITLDNNVTFIINDRIDIALICGADGLHLGLLDIGIKEARELLGVEKLIGLSTHNAEEAREAVSLGADYISFGPIFSTRTKPDAHAPGGIEGLSTIRAAIQKCPLPITAIGGLSAKSVAKVIENGASMAAVISNILLAKDISAEVKKLIKEIGPPPTVG